jgi:hypothetical protein
MACSDCKKKKELREEFNKMAGPMERWALITIVGIFALAVYGIWSLISRFL